jgi:DNA polymerase III delta prime subunit
MAEPAVLMEVDNKYSGANVGEKRKVPMDKGKGVAGAEDDAKKNQMWVEKYRPSRLADVAAHKDIIDTISKLTREDRLPHLLLYGPPGTGKTSTILAVARELYGPSFSQMVLELNASDGTIAPRSRGTPSRPVVPVCFFKHCKCCASKPRARRPSICAQGVGKKNPNPFPETSSIDPRSSPLPSLTPPSLPVPFASFTFIRSRHRRRS